MKRFIAEFICDQCKAKTVKYETDEYKILDYGLLDGWYESLFHDRVFCSKECLENWLKKNDPDEYEFYTTSVWEG